MAEDLPASELVVVIAGGICGLVMGGRECRLNGLKEKAGVWASPPSSGSTTTTTAHGELLPVSFLSREFRLSPFSWEDASPLLLISR